MSCSGLHCAGCGGGSAAPVVILAALEGFEWLAAHVVEVLVTSTTCGVLAVAAVVALMRSADRRDARRTALWAVRAEAVTPPRAAAAVTSTGHPALGFRDLHIHLDGLAPAEQAAIIRQALPGTARGAITEGK